MDNLIFCLNGTMPIFILMILGYVFNKINIVDDVLSEKMNKFVFKVALPVLLFKDIADADFTSSWDGKYVLFGIVVTTLSILIMVGASFLLKDKSIRGEFIQAGYRISQALLGAAYLQNLYGDVTAVPLMLIGSVPIYNMAAVIVLSVMKPQSGGLDKSLFKKTIKGIITNPLIIGLFVGTIWSCFKLPQPEIFKKTVSSISSVATPLGLIALGASLDIEKAFGKLKPAIACTIFKLFIFVGLFLPIAVYLGYRNDKLVALLIMMGAATTVSSFVMAKNMGHEGTLSSSTVMMTTFFSSFSITMWLYLLKWFSLI